LGQKYNSKKTGGTGVPAGADKTIAPVVVEKTKPF